MSKGVNRNHIKQHSCFMRAARNEKGGRRWLIKQMWSGSQGTSGEFAGISTCTTFAYFQHGSIFNIELSLTLKYFDPGGGPARHSLALGWLDPHLWLPREENKFSIFSAWKVTNICLCLIDIAKYCLLIGHCSRITRLVGCSVGCLLPCQKWPNSQEVGC